MKYLDEYRDNATAQKLLNSLRNRVTRRWTLMEVCGGQTHAIVKHGIDHLLPDAITLVHGPGCPVCVTPLETIDRAHAIAARPDVIFCSFGDMLRVPGTSTDLLRLRSLGATVKVVFSPLDCLKIAQANPQRQVVFFAIGFETTAPANAMLAWQAQRLGLRNLSLLVSLVRVPPAVAAILQTPENRVQGFLGPGHVCTIMGASEYEELVARYHVPIVISGFEPLDILDGILRAVTQLEEGRAEVENPYARAVELAGNPVAQGLLASTFELCDQKWRGVGMIAQSGYRLRESLAAYDASRRFDLGDITTAESAVCLSGQVLRGLIKPHQCPAFGKSCTPLHPLGATMVSSEGACAAYYQYARAEVAERVDSPGQGPP